MLISLFFVAETRLQSGNDGKLELLPRATLVEARGSLRDVAFAPSEFGMKLVSHSMIQALTPQANIQPPLRIAGRNSCRLPFTHI